MSTIKSFDKQNLKEVRAEIDKALKEVSKKLGITLSIGNIRFDQSQFTTRLTANVASGAKLTIQSIAHPTLNGLPEVGTKFTSRGRTFEVVGHMLSRPKYPIRAKRLPDEKLFKFSLDQVNEALQSA